MTNDTKTEPTLLEQIVRMTKVGELVKQAHVDFDMVYLPGKMGTRSSVALLAQLQAILEGAE